MRVVTVGGGFGTRGFGVAGLWSSGWRRLFGSGLGGFGAGVGRTGVRCVRRIWVEIGVEIGLEVEAETEAVDIAGVAVELVDVTRCNGRMLFGL